MQVIGLGHYSRVGKDTFGLLLANELEKKGSSVQVVSFANKLKHICHDVFGVYGLKYGKFYDTPETACLRSVPIPGLGQTPVELWVAVGCALRRIKSSVWIDNVLSGGDIQSDFLIVTDVRFPNEVEAIRGLGGVVFKVERNGVKPKDTEADQALLDYTGWDKVIHNTSGFSSLHRIAEQTSDELLNSSLVAE